MIVSTQNIGNFKKGVLKEKRIIFVDVSNYIYPLKTTLSKRKLYKHIDKESFNPHLDINVYFRMNFKLRIRFGGSWVSTENWLEPKTKPP